MSDELGLYAHPRAAVITASQSVLIEAINALVEQEAIAEVVVGLPLSLSGAETAQTAVVRNLVAILRKRLTVPVTVWDERLSSVEAARHVSREARRRSGELDSAAAALILQAVLDSRRGGARQ